MSGEERCIAWTYRHTRCVGKPATPGGEFCKRHGGTTPTPAPVPSEADPGTGEHYASCDGSAECECAYTAWLEAEPPLPPRLLPATPDAGDVEALTAGIRNAHALGPGTYSAEGWHAAVGRLLDRLASHDAATADRVRRGVAGGIAAAIEAHADQHAPAHTRRTFLAAARIAREAGR
jgi:hypothetical protein